MTDFVARRLSATVGTHFHRIRRVDDPHWDALMSIYETVFKEGEKESRASFEANLSVEGREITGGHIVLASLDAYGNSRGGIIFSYLRAVNCGYISYLMVEPGMRWRGLGTGLFYAAKAVLDSHAQTVGHAAVDGVFTEIEKESPLDPDTRERFRFWERLGVFPLDVEWIYPELAPGRTPVNMYLAYGPLGGRRTWTVTTLKSAVKEIFRVTYVYLPEASSALTKVLGRLEAISPNATIAYRHPSLWCRSGDTR